MNIGNQHPKATPRSPVAAIGTEVWSHPIRRFDVVVLKRGYRQFGQLSSGLISLNRVLAR